MEEELAYGNLLTCAELAAYVSRVGFLPLLSAGGCPSAEMAVAEECRYVELPEGGWEWPLWKWKGQIIRESQCGYGKLFGGRVGFVSREWWPYLCCYRRSRYPESEDGSVEQMILQTLAEQGSMITRELRRLCGFTGPKMRSRFDAYLTRLQMACRIVTEDFVYPHDRQGREYGWGWSLLTTPEALLGREACRAPLAPQQSHDRMLTHLRQTFPDASERALAAMLG